MNKEIEEMAKLSYQSFDKYCNGIMHCNNCEFKNISASKNGYNCANIIIARELYDAGYRKIYGSVKEFDDIIHNQEQEIERLKNLLKQNGIEV